jgi:hypothetical protein
MYNGTLKKHITYPTHHLPKLLDLKKKEKHPLSNLAKTVQDLQRKENHTIMWFLDSKVIC